MRPHLILAATLVVFASGAAAQESIEEKRLIEGILSIKDACSAQVPETRAALQNAYNEMTRKNTKYKTAIEWRALDTGKRTVPHFTFDKAQCNEFAQKIAVSKMDEIIGQLRANQAAAAQPATPQPAAK